MSSTSRRTTPLPPDWPQRRQAVLHRDGHRCTWVTNGQRCPVTNPTGRGLEIDHLGPPHDHRLTMLRTLCTPHHRTRTAHQANNAKTPRRRPTEPHPGELTP